MQFDAPAGCFCSLWLQFWMDDGEKSQARRGETTGSAGWGLGDDEISQRN
jgi:hypothetical protein